VTDFASDLQTALDHLIAARGIVGVVLSDKGSGVAYTMSSLFSTLTTTLIFLIRSFLACFVFGLVFVLGVANYRSVLFLAQVNPAQFWEVFGNPKVAAFLIARCLSDTGLRLRITAFQPEPWALWVYAGIGCQIIFALGYSFTGIMDRWPRIAKALVFVSVLPVALHFLGPAILGAVARAVAALVVPIIVHGRASNLGWRLWGRRDTVLVLVISLIVAFMDARVPGLLGPPLAFMSAYASAAAMEVASRSWCGHGYFAWVAL